MRTPAASVGRTEGGKGVAEAAVFHAAPPAQPGNKRQGVDDRTSVHALV